MGYDPYNPRNPAKEKSCPPEKAKKAAARKATKPKQPDDDAMFSEQETGEATVNTIAAGQLRAFIERIERLEEDKATIAEDIKEVYAEAKGNGFHTKAIRTIVRLRKQDQAERQEEEAILDLYKAALGMA